VAGNRIQLWGKVLVEPELRTTPAGTSVLRIIVQAGDSSSPNFALAASMTGEDARRVAAGLKAGVEVTVEGSLKAVRRPTRSGIVETAYEVMADSIEVRATD
jgi:single-stranded DNA-binding protein